MKALRKLLRPLLDLALCPFVYLAALLLRQVRAWGMQRLPRCRETLRKVGVFPIRDHYYEPLFNSRRLVRPLTDERSLPGIDWNVSGQLELLGRMHFGSELRDLGHRKTSDGTFHFSNGNFESGDAEYWYGLLRLRQPSRIIEIGSGYSTLMAAKAVRRNQEEDPGYRCELTCVEPYEMPWLERLGVTVVRRRVEEVGASFFADLGENDVLFIDSSHMIRPQGDVLFEYLELLPSLRKGVLVHVHDIFSPRDYLAQWVVDEVLFWNEQYLLEAFLTGNPGWRIVGALNYLHHHHYDQLKAQCPFLTPEREPGSFYFEKIV
jgi:hypothetical protein